MPPLRVLQRYGGLNEWAAATPVDPGTGAATAAGQAAAQAPWPRQAPPAAGLATQASWRPAAGSASGSAARPGATSASVSAAPAERGAAGGSAGRPTATARSPKGGGGAEALGGPSAPPVGASGFFKGTGQVTNKSLL